MSEFLSNTMIDIRRGRQSWRVFVALCAPSFTLAILAGLLQH